MGHFEILMLGDFGFFISCLDFNTRKKLSTKLKYDVSGDTNREVIYKFIYILKDLRNAVAHNDVIHDTRFKRLILQRLSKFVFSMKLVFHMLTSNQS